jgi:hypothetical protein
VDVGRVGQRLLRHVAGPEAAVGADDVEGRPLAAGPDRQHARRGLHVVAAHEQRRVDAVAPEQRHEHVAERIGADRAGAAHGGAEPGQHQGGPARRAGGRHADLLDQLAALALRDPLDRPDQHVEHVHAHRDGLHASAFRVAP